MCRQKKNDDPTDKDEEKKTHKKQGVIAFCNSKIHYSVDESYTNANKLLSKGRYSRQIVGGKTNLT